MTSHRITRETERASRTSDRQAGGQASLIFLLFIELKKRDTWRFPGRRAESEAIDK